MCPDARAGKFLHESGRKPGLLFEIASEQPNRRLLLGRAARGQRSRGQPMEPLPLGGIGAQPMDDRCQCRGLVGPMPCRCPRQHRLLVPAQDGLHARQHRDPAGVAAGFGKHVFS